MPSTRIAEFDTWRPGYGFAVVSVYRAGTTILADIFTDENLTVAGDNPQTLLEKTVDDVSYGKFALPLYTSQAHYLHINSVDQTGITRPGLTTLDTEDASDSTVIPEGGSEAIELGEWAGRTIDARNFGEILPVGAVGASASANTAAITAAIGAATAEGGGFVEVPDGIYDVTPISIPLGVILRGRGVDATTLQCTQGGKIITLAGARSGLSRITIDGVTKVALSIGVYGLALARPILDDVVLKRFETGLIYRGGQGARFRDLVVSDCSLGARWLGDLDTAGTGNGASLDFPLWIGGRVEFCSVAGLEIKYVDLPIVNAAVRNVDFYSNTGSALKVFGSRSIHVSTCSFDENTVDLEVLDGTPLSALNSVIDLKIDHSRFIGGEINLTGTLESVQFSRCDFEDNTITLTSPGNTVIAQDCRETGVTLAGTSTAWARSYENRIGATAGLTTGNAATKVWGLALDPGQGVYLEAKVVGRGRNTIDTAFYHITVSAARPGASLAYDTQTGQFTVGNVLTGATSGATGRITADADGGTTGTLTLQDLVGTFADNEIITDGSTGSATANGTQSYSDAALVGSITSIRAAQETDSDFACVFVANGPEIEVQVTGDTAKTVEWVAYVDWMASN